jgi:predicted small metal-binding protein
MKSRIVLSALALALIFTTSAWSQSQEMKQEAKKATEHATMGKAETAPLKSFSCPGPCNFQVNSRDEKEISDAAIAHVKKHHNMTMTEKEVVGQLTTVTPKSEKK